MADFIIDRDCDILAECLVACESKEEAEKIVNCIDTDLYISASDNDDRKYICVAPSLAEFFPETANEAAYAKIEVGYTYVESCEGYNGHGAIGYSEPSESLYVEALEADDKEIEMLGEIEDVILDSGYDCLSMEIKESGTTSLDSLCEKEESNQRSHCSYYEERDDL